MRWMWDSYSTCGVPAEGVTPKIGYFKGCDRVEKK